MIIFDGLGNCLVLVWGEISEMALLHLYFVMYERACEVHYALYKKTKIRIYFILVSIFEINNNYLVWKLV